MCVCVFLSMVLDGDTTPNIETHVSQKYISTHYSFSCLGKVSRQTKPLRRKIYCSYAHTHRHTLRKCMRD